MRFKVLGPKPETLNSNPKPFFVGVLRCRFLGSLGICFLAVAL